MYEDWEAADVLGAQWRGCNMCNGNILKLYKQKMM